MSESYRRGFEDGLTAYAHWRDGRQEVGTTGTTLKKALEEIEKTWNWNPPPEDPGDEGPAPERWDHMTVWFKGRHWYIANLVDGDDGIGPFDSEADAEAALKGLRAAKRILAARPAPERENGPDEPCAYCEHPRSSHHATYLVTCTERACGCEHFQTSRPSPERPEGDR